MKLEKSALKLNEYDKMVFKTAERKYQIEQEKDDRQRAQTLETLLNQGEDFEYQK